MVGFRLIMGFRESLGFCLFVGWIWMYCVDSSLSGGCLMGCVLCLGLLWMGCCDHLFCSWMGGLY